MLMLRVSGIRKADYEAYGRNRDRIDKRVAKAARCLKGRRSDERHQPTAPAIPDVIRDGHGGVAR
jgi:hypothetical protein